MNSDDPQSVLDALLLRCHETRTSFGDGHVVWRTWGEADPVRPTLVLLHGGSGAWNHWVRTIPAFEANYRIIAPDLPGCGDSDLPPQPIDAESLASILSDGLDKVVPDDRAFDLVSFSFGGLLSGLVARAQARRILSLTIVGSPILGLNRDGPANDLTSVPPGLSQQEAAPIYRSNLEKLMVRNPERIDDLAMTMHMANMARVRLRSRGIARRSKMADTLRDLPCRMNFIFGEGDVTLWPDLAGIRDYVQENHPDSTVHVIPEAGHWVQYESPEAFNTLLMRVLAE
tara:strand:- start:449 stop:1306 length:858 start_codon:yes stop_codon:yes gene_type:complete